MSCPKCSSPRTIPFRHHPPPTDGKAHAALVKAGHDHWNHCAVMGTLCLNCRILNPRRTT